MFVIDFAVTGLSDPIPATVPWLSLSILVPIVGALLVPFIPDQGEGKQVRWYALVVTLTTFLLEKGGRHTLSEGVRRIGGSVLRHLHHLCRHRKPLCCHER